MRMSRMNRRKKKKKAAHSRKNSDCTSSVSKFAHETIPIGLHFGFGSSRQGKMEEGNFAEKQWIGV